MSVPATAAIMTAAGAFGAAAGAPAGGGDAALFQMLLGAAGAAPQTPAPLSTPHWAADSSPLPASPVVAPASGPAVNETANALLSLQAAPAAATAQGPTAPAVTTQSLMAQTPTTQIPATQPAAPAPATGDRAQPAAPGMVIMAAADLGAAGGSITTPPAPIVKWAPLVPLAANPAAPPQTVAAQQSAPVAQPAALIEGPLVEAAAAPDTTQPAAPAPIAFVAGLAVPAAAAQAAPTGETAPATRVEETPVEAPAAPDATQPAAPAAAPAPVAFAAGLTIPVVTAQAAPTGVTAPADDHFEAPSPFQAVTKAGGGKPAAQVNTPALSGAEAAAKAATTTAADGVSAGGDSFASAITYPGAEAARVSADPAAAAQAHGRPAAPGSAAISLAQQIVRRFDGRSTHFAVRMDPPELGRVDVNITVDKDNQVTARIGADSAATLTDLRAAARELERALSDAGLDLAQGGLSFDLNHRQQAADDGFDAPKAGAQGGEADTDDAVAAAAAPARPFGMERWSPTGLDVWA